MLKASLTFVVILFIVLGVTESPFAGVFCGVVGAAVLHVIQSSKQKEALNSTASAQYHKSNDPIPQDTQDDALNIEKRVATLEQQVSQLKQQLLQVLNAKTLNTETAVKVAVTASPTASPDPAKLSPTLATTSIDEARASVYTAPKLSNVPNTLPPEASLNSHTLTQTPSPSPKPNSASDPIPTPTLYTPPKRHETPPSPKPSVIGGFIASGIQAIKNWLMGGNTLVRVGIIILFFGVAFLLKFAADNNYIPIEIRLLTMAALGIALVGIGFRVRDTVGKKGFSFALQGGGVGVMYLTIFAAFKMYQLIPQSLSFALLAGVAFASASLAVLQSALPLAVLGFAGGFAAPILISTGSGSHVALFSYYLVLNLGIAFVAYFRDWRVLNVMGFTFTFVISTLWGVQKYTPDLFASTEPFLIAHGVIYTFIAIAYAFKRAPSAKDYVDATLVFGTPLVGFGLQYGLLKDSPMGMAYSALALGGYYMVLAWWIMTHKRETLNFLGECFLSLAIGFATLAIPLSLDGRWISASWALEGVALLWVGLKQARFLPSFAGLALQVLGALMFVKGWGLTGSTGEQGQNMFLGAAFIALSGLACGALLLRHSRANAVANESTVTHHESLADTADSFTLSQRLHEKLSQCAPALSTAAAMWSWAWLMLSGIKGIAAWTGDVKHLLVFLNPLMLFIVLAGLALYAIARKLNWPMLRVLSFAALPAMVATAALMVVGNVNIYRAPSLFLGWLCWPVAIAAYGFMLRWDKDTSADIPLDLSQNSALGLGQNLGISSKWQWQSPLLWLACGLGLLEINYWLELKTTVLMSIAYAAEGAVVVWLGLRSVRWLPKAMVNPWVMVLGGLCVQAIAGFMYWHEQTNRYINFDNDDNYWHVAVFGSLVWVSAYLVRQLNSKLSLLLTVIGWLVWVLAGILFTDYLSDLKLSEMGAMSRLHWIMTYLAALSIAIYWLGRRLAWPSLWRLGFAVLPFIGLGVLAEGLIHTPLSDHGWMAWPALLLTLPLLLHWQNKAMPTNTETRSMAAPWDFATGWLWRAPWLWALAWLSMRQAYDFTAAHAGGDWPVLAGLTASFIVVMVTLRVNAKAAAPQSLVWLAQACGPVVACLLAYSIYATLNLAGNTPPLPYITVLNPLELGLLGIVMLAGLWFNAIKPLIDINRVNFVRELMPHTPKLLAMLGFVWLNSVLLRSLYHYADVPYLWLSVLNHPVARAAFTLLWSLSALGLMLYAHKKAARLLWMVGAALMVVVVAKLFLLDLSGRGTVERIVSFMGAGILLLVMGYFAPLPPAKKPND